MSESPGPVLGTPIRLDPEPLDRGWRAPRRGGSGWTGSQRFLIVLAVLLLVLGGIWTAGGFQKRADRTRTYTAGQVVDVGPMTLTLERVEITFSPKASYLENDFDKWQVTAYGTATSKESEPLQLSLDPGLVLLETGRRFKADLLFGSGTGISMLQPGLKNVPVRVTGEIRGDWAPTGQLRVGMWQHKYGPQQEMADSRRSWGSTSTAVVFWCPVTRLPDEAY